MILEDGFHQDPHLTLVLNDHNDGHDTPRAVPTAYDAGGSHWFQRFAAQLELVDHRSQCCEREGADYRRARAVGRYRHRCKTSFSSLWSRALLSGTGDLKEADIDYARLEAGPAIRQVVLPHSLEPFVEPKAFDGGPCGLEAAVPLL